MRTNEYYRIYALDWDDNIIRMPTKIILINKTSKKEKAISTDEFAIHRNEIGVSGKYENYAVDTDEQSKNFSYRFFRDKNEENYFLDDLLQELQKKSPQYQKSWATLVKALSSKNTAKNTYIITARGHSPSTIFEAFKHLKKIKIIKYLPPIKNIYPVTHYVKSYQDMGEIKSKFIMDILDKYEKMSKNNDYNSFHNFSFSDDDANTIMSIASHLGGFYQKGKWRQFQIALHYTGESKKLVKGSYVLGFNGDLVFQKPFPEDRK